MGMREKILVVDDDEGVLNSINNILTVRDYFVDLANSGEEAVGIIKEGKYDLVITDLMMGGMSGMDLLKEIKIISPDTAVIVVSGHGTLEMAIECTKLGAYDFVPKPFNDEELALRIERGLKSIKDERERNFLRSQVEQKFSFDNIISKDYKMLKIFDQIKGIAETDTSVLILGETGTGKELIAKSIHFHSSRKNSPFVAIHCAALSETLLESELFGHEKGAFTGAFKQKEGKFEQANGGTVFLDEVGDIPLVTQVKLLRVLQEKTFERVGGTELIKTDIRILAATNRDLKKLISEGTFREDLFYRLNVFPVSVPPLRERKGDIPILIDYFLKQLNAKLNKDVKKVSEQALERLLKYSWPGNIRELENVLERGILVCKGEVIENSDLELEAVDSGQEKLVEEDIENYEEFRSKVLDNTEKSYFIRMLNKYNGDIDAVIKSMGISQRTLYNRVKEFGINLKMFYQ
jgi:DNA-binding NtrC family response regulator